MNPEDQYSSRIEAYLGEVMSPEEARSFEQDLQRDPQLAKAFDNYQRVQGVVERYLEEELRQKMDRWERKGHRIRRLQPLAIAAALVLLLALAFWLFKPTSPQLSGPELAVQYYEAPTSPEQQLGETEAVWQEAVADYNAGRYGVFIEKIESLDSLTAQMQYYLAHSYFQTKQYEAAIPLFATLAAGNSLFNRRAEWYEVLTRLATGEPPSSVEASLRQIAADENHPRHRLARELLDGL